MGQHMTREQILDELVRLAVVAGESGYGLFENGILLVVRVAQQPLPICSLLSAIGCMIVSLVEVLRAEQQKGPTHL